VSNLLLFLAIAATNKILLTARNYCISEPQTAPPIPSPTPEQKRTKTKTGATPGSKLGTRLPGGGSRQPNYYYPLQ